MTGAVDHQELFPLKKYWQVAVATSKPTFVKTRNESKIDRMSICRLIALKVLSTFFALFGPYAYGQDTLKPRLEFDHILLFVRNTSLKDSLDQIFTPAEKLTTKHENQGTIGYYYLFYNTYLELLFLQDSSKVIENLENFGSDFLSRWSNNSINCPIGFGMIQRIWDPEKYNPDFHPYRSSDSPEGEYYLMSPDNQTLSDPLIYVSQPHRAYKAIDSPEALEQRPEEIREVLKRYLSHPTEVQRITDIIYFFSNGNEKEGNIGRLQEYTTIEVDRSPYTSLTLVFDHRRKDRKVFWINDHAKLIIEY